MAELFLPPPHPRAWCTLAFVSNARVSPARYALLLRASAASGLIEIIALSRFFVECVMAITLDDLLPSAVDCRKKIALTEAEKASALVRRQAAEEAEKRELLERFEKPSGVSDEERLKRVASIIQRAVDNGLTEIVVGRFPNTLCTDRGRAINQQEPGWENTMTGIPKEIFQLWVDYLKPRGYRIGYQT